MFCKIFNINFKLPFKNGFLNGKNFKPSDFKRINLSEVDVKTLNWNACCRHRNFNKEEIITYLDFVSIKQLEIFSLEFNKHIKHLLTHQIDV
jgi:hypothetical protein